MQRLRSISFLRACVSALFLLTVIPLAGPASAQEGETSFTNESLGYTVEWTSDWIIDVVSPDKQVVSISRGDAMYLWIEGFDGSRVSPNEAVAAQVDDTIIEDHSDEEFPWLMREGQVVPLRTHAFTIDDGATTIRVSIETPEVFMELSYEYVMSEVTINGVPALTEDFLGSSPVIDLTTTSDETPEATEESGSTGIRTTRGTTSDETPEATEESGSTGIRTTRGNTDETPEATDEPTEVATEEVVSSSDLETFTGPVYGYSISYDPEIWTLDAEIEDEGVDGIRLVSESSTYTIWAWDAYGSDPAACLDGESDYYGTQMETISDFEPITGSDGEPLRYESENLAWGVFSLNYTNESGDTYPLIDYISCEPIPGQDAVLIILLSSDPDPYNDNLDNALDVLDTLQFADASGDSGTDNTETATETATEETSTGEEIDTNLDGTLYTSPNFGFTVDIPLQWNVVDESSSSTDEQLVVSNGTSEVTIWATSEYSGELEGCVDYAANASGLDLMLDSDSSGGEFRGTYRGESFANFVYDDGGTKMMYFVNCQQIDDTDGYLIVIQDVEYDLFASERRFRSEIENSIVMP